MILPLKLVKNQDVSDSNIFSRCIKPSNVFHVLRSLHKIPPDTRLAWKFASICSPKKQGKKVQNKSRTIFHHDSSWVPPQTPRTLIPRRGQPVLWGTCFHLWWLFLKSLFTTSNPSAFCHFLLRRRRSRTSLVSGHMVIKSENFASDVATLLSAPCVSTFHSPQMWLNFRFVL